MAAETRPLAPWPEQVRVVEWPRQRDLLEGEAESPVLIIVDDDAVPPTPEHCCHDWMWRSGGEVELRTRLHQLSLRALRHGQNAPTLDEYGTLRLGLRTVQLPPKERLIVEALLRRLGESVPRDELVAAAWPDGISSPNTVASRISQTRARLRWLGLEITGLADGSYRLQAAAAGVTSDTAGAEDDVHLAARRRRSPGDRPVANRPSDPGDRGRPTIWSADEVDR